MHQQHGLLKYPYTTESRDLYKQTAGTLTAAAHRLSYMMDRQLTQLHMSPKHTQEPSDQILRCLFTLNCPFIKSIKFNDQL